MTIFINGGKVAKTRQHIDRFTGDMVLHCHVSTEWKSNFGRDRVDTDCFSHRSSSTKTSE